MDINGYFEMYIKNRIKYDRLEHMRNIGLLDVTIIDINIIKKIFVYIDSILFNGTMMAHIIKNSIDFRFSENKTTTSVGMFYMQSYPNKTKIMGFAIANKFFQNILDKNIINIDLGVLDEKNKPCLSSVPIEPLMTTMEHEMIHMLMHITEGNKYNDIKTVKSGHTKIFKILVYNIFGHYRITSSYAIGDIKKNTESKDNIDIGDVIRDKTSATIGYVVGKKKHHLITCSINKDNTNNGDYVYKTFLYKDVDKIDDADNNINVLRLLDRLKPDVKIRFNNMDFTILKVNQTNIMVKSLTQKWKIPKVRVLEFIFRD
jgi:hypothetical protein